ncbi:MAG: DUF177 domain-containing protein [Chloroflexi bacterium]|jgi:uncharacterized protein|nr:DUF177 domain-containing protein [Chloroflexota bacterium]MBT7081351.1 DUF177 domain-containing protein [Chloroflexota bacterium]MBT7290659.1 DUF177 domain-containing protein [Chloroflexota bacterium]
MIKINVAQQLKHTVGVAKQYKVSETDEALGLNIYGELNLVRTDKGILVTGKLNTLKKLACSRCLSVFDHPVSLDFLEEYVPTMDVISGTPLSTPDGLFTITNNHEICLDDALSQYEVLALPMKPLCRPDCKGLCDHCGSNLNIEDCSCSNTIDPRWAALAGLALNDIQGNSREE